MSLFCIRCGTQLRPEDVNASTGIARCHVCGQRFDTTNRGSADIAPPHSGDQAIPRPANMRVEHQGRRLTIHWRWFTAGAFVVAIFCVAWDSFIFFWYSRVLADPHAPWIMVVFPVVHVAAGVAITYATLCGFVNSTTVEMSPDALTIRHGPLPWFGNRYLPASQIRQPFCERIQNTRNAGHTSNVSTIFNLNALLGDGTKVKLVQGLTDYAQALYLKKQIELAMNIKPQPVAGEYTM